MLMTVDEMSKNSPVLNAAGKKGRREPGKSMILAER